MGWVGLGGTASFYWEDGTDGVPTTITKSHEITDLTSRTAVSGRPVEQSQARRKLLRELQLGAKTAAAAGL